MQRPREGTGEGRMEGHKPQKQVGEVRVSLPPGGETRRDGHGRACRICSPASGGGTQPKTRGEPELSSPQPSWGSRRARVTGRLGSGPRRCRLLAREEASLRETKSPRLGPEREGLTLP